MVLAVQADGATVTTVEGLAPDGELTPLQQAFSDQHALQCGYCTPGMLMSASALLEANPSPSEEEIKVALQGNLCRCTGYWNILEAVQQASGGGA
jgi:carbon-monoxide dehydrogenase small subunit